MLIYRVSPKPCIFYTKETTCYNKLLTIPSARNQILTEINQLPLFSSNYAKVNLQALISSQTTGIFLCGLIHSFCYSSCKDLKNLSIFHYLAVLISAIYLIQSDFLNSGCPNIQLPPQSKISIYNIFIHLPQEVFSIP